MKYPFGLVCLRHDDAAGLTFAIQRGWRLGEAFVDEIDEAARQGTARAVHMYQPQGKTRASRMSPSFKVV